MAEEAHCRYALSKCLAGSAHRFRLAARSRRC
jgi:hypothetical protein